MIEYCSKNLIFKLRGIEMKSIYEQKGRTYTKAGKYYVPNVSAPDIKKYQHIYELSKPKALKFGLFFVVGFPIPRIAKAFRLENP